MDKISAEFYLTIDPCTFDEARALYDHLKGLHINADVSMHLSASEEEAMEALALDPSATASAAPQVPATTIPAAPAPAPVPTPAAAPAPAPAPVAAPAAPAAPVAPATPQAPAAPAAATPAAADRIYTLEELSDAGSWLVDQGKMEAVMDLLATKYGVDTVVKVPETSRAAFAADLRALGANI